jgi:site-specific DNA recombinase
VPVKRSKPEGRRLRAVIYARYSSDNQREESTIAQLRAGHEHIRKKNYLFVGEYKDEELTGRNDRRDDFQRMIDDAKKGLFDIVVVHKFNRFARNRYDSAIYKRQLKKLGIRVESVTQPLDDSPESVLLEALLEGMDEYYSLDLAREVRKGMTENALQGKHAGGRPPYGLKVNPETRLLEIDERTYKAVQIYFKGIDNDVPLEEIAKTLNEMGYRTQEGRKFTKHSFDTWARNRKYRGDYVWNVSAAKDEDGIRHGGTKPPDQHIVIPGIIPAIIDPELWDRVNKKLNERKRKPGRMKAKVPYLLTGKIYCGQCGALYAGNSYRNPKSSENTLLTYYKCQAKCGNTSVRKADIENIAIEQLLEHCFSEEGTRDIVARVQELYRQEKRQSERDIEPIKRELSELDSKIKNWTEALGAGVKSVIESIKQAEERKEALEYELQRAIMMQQVNELDEKLILKIIGSTSKLVLDFMYQIVHGYIRPEVLVRNVPGSG